MVHFLSVLAGVLLALAASGRSAGPLISADACQITRIVDGDTIECDGRRIRLLLVDSPERSQAPFGAQAAAALAQLIPVGTPILLEYDVDRTDRYGRTLAYLFVGRTFVNEAMVRQGFAVPLVYPPNVRYVERIRAAAAAARAARAGLWSVDAFDCLPVDARKGRC